MAFSCNTHTARPKSNCPITYQADILYRSESCRFHHDMNNGAFHIEALSDHFRNDRDDREGGVITLVDNNFQFKEWIDLKYEDLQTL